MKFSMTRTQMGSLFYLSLLSSMTSADLLTQEQNQLKHQQMVRETDEALRKAEKFLQAEGSSKRESILDEDKNTSRSIEHIMIDLAGQSLNLNFDPVIKQYKGKSLTTKNVFALVKDLTDVLYKAGYVTSAIGLKEKVTDKNELHFIVHWGYVNDYLINGTQPSNFKDKAMIFSLPKLKNKVLSIYDIDQLIEILNTINKSAEVKVIAAHENELSNLNLVTQRSYLPRVVIGFNNSGTENNANGRNQITANVSWSDLLGTNDSWFFSTGYRLYKKHKKNSQNNYSLSYTQPFSFYTLDLKLSQSDSERELNGIHSYSSDGKIKTGSIKVSKIFQRTKEAIFSGYSELEFKTRRNYIDKQLVGNFHNNKITSGLSYITNLLGGKLYTDISYSNGLNWFHANSSAYDSKGNKTLSVLSGTTSWYKPLTLKGKDLNYQLRLGFQYSPYSLYSDNQFSIGDEYTVRGFKGGISSGDSGYYVSQTVDMPFYPKKLAITQIKPFIGVDFGRTFRHSDHHKETILGAAIGSKVQMGKFSLSLTYAKPIKNTKIHRGDSNIYYISGSVTF